MGDSLGGYIWIAKIMNDEHYTRKTSKFVDYTTDRVVKTEIKTLRNSVIKTGVRDLNSIFTCKAVPTNLEKWHA